MKKLPLFLLSCLAFLSISIFADNIHCPPLNDVQQVTAAIKTGVYDHYYYKAGDSGPIYRIYADATPALPTNIIHWMSQQSKAHKPLLAIAILQDKTNHIQWLPAPMTIHYRGIQLCQYSAAGLFTMNSVFLSPHA